MHIRQLFVAGIILFGTAQMEAGKKGNSSLMKNYRKLKKKGSLNSQEEITLKILRKRLKHTAGSETSEQPNRNYGAALTNYGTQN